MKARLFTSVALAASMLTAPAVLPRGPVDALNPIAAARAQEAAVDIKVFFDRLQPYGQWVKHDRYNYVFVPNDVSADWKPYTVGHWTNAKEYGWTFVSDEPFAWATYHYGRWAYDEEIGWFWVPGTRWAPAWVSWRRGGDHIAWAPLPPEEDGYAVSVEVRETEIPEEDWVIVPARDFLAPDLATVVIDARDEPDLITRTEYVGPVRVERDIVVNNVIDVTYVEEVTRERVREVEIREVDDPDAVRIEGDSIALFRAKIGEPKRDEAPAEVVDREKVREVRERIRREEPSDTTATREERRDGERALREGEESRPESATADEQQRDRDRRRDTATGERPEDRDTTAADRRRQEERNDGTTARRERPDEPRTAEDALRRRDGDQATTGEGSDRKDEPRKAERRRDGETTTGARETERPEAERAGRTEEERSKAAEDRRPRRDTEAAEGERPRRDRDTAEGERPREDGERAVSERPRRDQGEPDQAGREVEQGQGTADAQRKRRPVAEGERPAADEPGREVGQGRAERPREETGSTARSERREERREEPAARERKEAPAAAERGRGEGGEQQPPKKRRPPLPGEGGEQ